MADFNDTQNQRSPMTPQPPGVPAQTASIVTALQAIARNQNALLVAIQDLGGILAPVYDVQSWTPGLAFGGSGVGITGTFSGTYTKTGRGLLCFFAITLTSKGAAVGSATITGLPATSGTVAGEAGSGGLVTLSSNMSGLTAAPIIINVPTAGTTASMLQQAAAGTAAITDARFTNTSALSGYFMFSNS